MDLSLVSYGVVMIFLAIVSYYDLKSFMIPNRILMVGGFLGLILLFFNKELPWQSAILGVGVVGGLGLAITYITKGSLGLGDAKLLACLGLYLGLWKLVNVLVISTILCGTVGLVLLAVGRVNKKTVMPFAPFVFISTLILLMGNQLG